MSTSLLALALAMSLGQDYPTIGPGASAEPMFPYDSQEPWLHGYWQDIPAYRGHEYFRPYNYKHVLSQTQTAAGWGITPQTAYSQQWWHRYQQQASMQDPAANYTQPVPAGYPGAQRTPQYYPGQQQQMLANPGYRNAQPQTGYRNQPTPAGYRY